MRKRSIPEVLEHFDHERSLDEQFYQDHCLLISLVKKINLAPYDADNDSLSDFRNHIISNLIDHYTKEHLPVSVLSYVVLTISVNIILHIMLSMGIFVTEIDLLSHSCFRNTFCFCKWIGNNEDKESLKRYADNVIHIFVVEQV